MSRSVRLSITVAFCLLVSGSAWAATYPSPPHDFSHAASPHSPLYSVTAGQEDRPMLVIYLRWDDVDYRPGFDAAVVAGRFFGTGPLPGLGFPSVSDYFRRNSFNDLFLPPALETQGTMNDGVVQVTIPGTRADFFAQPIPVRNRLAVEAADEWVDYEEFDSDGNGALSNLEMVLNVLEAEPMTPLWRGAGIARGIQAVSLDGTALGGLGVAMNNDATNLMTIIHENGHVALNQDDLYIFGVGHLDVGGPTTGYPDEKLYAPTAWQKMHWGWITPIVVTRDGFYDIRNGTATGDAFILYDPDRGTDDYFMVETRRQSPGTYDQGVSDTGLVIWRIDETQYDSPDPLVRPIDLMRPDGAMTAETAPGNNTDAWNPADTNTPERTMERTWRDGTPSRVAVRAIEPASNTVRAYLDVRGPGFLVDTFPVDLNGPVNLTAGSSGSFTVPVMNTGEACDTFRVEPINLPAGWTMTPSGRILCAGEDSVALVEVRPDVNAAEGVQTISVRGRSLTDPSVTSMGPLFVRVNLRKTKFGLAGLDVASPTGATATLSVRVIDSEDPLEPPLAGIPVTFKLAGDGGTLTARAITNADGVATVTPNVTLPAGSYSLTIETERVGAQGPTSTTVPYTIERRPTTLAYTGGLTADYSDPAAVSATLIDTLTGAPLDSKPIVFALGSQSTGATTNAAGATAGTIVVDQAAGDAPLSVSFAGDATYLPSSDADTFAITKESLTFAYTGDRVAGSGATPTLATIATEEADGSAGDPSRAQADFSLQPTFSPAPFQYTAAVTSSGGASTPAVGVPGDLWRITVRVPAANGFWEGTSPASAENLLATDTGRCADVDGKHMKTSNGASADFEVDCELDEDERELDGELTFTTGATFRAQSVLALGLASNNGRAYFAGFGLDARPFIAYVEDNHPSGKTDVFHLWIGETKHTTTGALTGGKVKIKVKP